jgi:hypothetical protein
LLYVFSVRGSGPPWQAGRNRALEAAVGLSAAATAAALAVGPLREAFDLRPLSPGQVALALGLAMPPTVAAELVKLRLRRAARARGTC